MPKRDKSTKARRRRLSPVERRRYRAIVREMIRLFAFAPERVDTLERVLRAYVEDLPPLEAAARMASALALFEKNVV